MPVPVLPDTNTAGKSATPLRLSSSHHGQTPDAAECQCPALAVHFRMDLPRVASSDVHWSADGLPPRTEAGAKAASNMETIDGGRADIGRLPGGGAIRVRRWSAE